MFKRDRESPDSPYEIPSVELSALPELLAPSVLYNASPRSICRRWDSVARPVAASAVLENSLGIL